MRKLMYKVNAAGSFFETSSYSVAHSPGNKIVETFLIEISQRTPEETQKAKERMIKRQAFRLAKEIRKG